MPIPGSPPTSTREPFTIPPPITLSSSELPVLSLCSILSEISSSDSGFDKTPISLCWTWDSFCSTSSTRVFHCPHSGHLPIHFGDSLPHSLHTNFVFTLAISTPHIKLAYIESNVFTLNNHIRYFTSFVNPI